MRLFFDTETSGLMKDDLPPDHPSQPNLVQLAARLYDAKWKCVGSVTALIKPNGWSIEPEAEAHHGISESRCARYGVELVYALGLFKELATNARQIVAHNMQFDRRVIDAALYRVGAEGLWWRKKALVLGCTMEASTPVCQIGGAYGLKYPSLEEAHRFLMPTEPYATAHDAEADVLACVRVFRALEEIGAAPEVISPTAGRF